MARPGAHEWDVLGHDSDPVPGNPESVARLGRELRKTADAIKRQAGEIRALSKVDSWKGKAADSFRKEAEEADGKLQKAFKRYDVASRAMGTEVREGQDESGQFASELHRAQKAADKALRAAQEADQEASGAKKALDGQKKDTPKDDPARVKLEGRQDAADSALAQARKDLDAAVLIRKNAEDAAAKKIRDVIDDDGLKDGTWDKFKDWVHDNADLLKKIGDIAGWVATAAGGLALLVGWIPVVGQALAGVLGTIALMATAVSLVTHVMLALAGEGGWFDVALDVVGLATFGIGRAAVGGAKAAGAGTKAAARSTLYQKEMAKHAGKKLSKNALNRAQEKAWKAARKGSADAPRGKASAEAMKNTPSGWFPGKQAVFDAFNPKKIVGDSVDSVKDLKALKDSPDLLRRETWRGVGKHSVDGGLDDIGRQVGAIDDAAKSSDGVKSALNGLDAQTKLWSGTTGVATVIDGSDKFGVYDPLKDATTVGNG
jgi:hypothetical protein